MSAHADQAFEYLCASRLAGFYVGKRRPSHSRHSLPLQAVSVAKQGLYALPEAGVRVKLEEQPLAQMYSASRIKSRMRVRET